MAEVAGKVGVKKLKTRRRASQNRMNLHKFHLLLQQKSNLNFPANKMMNRVGQKNKV